MALGPTGNRYNAATYWDLGTRYMTPQDAQLLDSLAYARQEDALVPGAAPGLHVYDYPEGYFVSFDPEHLKESGGFEAIKRWSFSPDFVRIIQTAIKNGVGLIRFDADGGECDEFPEHQW
jgi:hypothetical protein